MDAELWREIIQLVVQQRNHRIATRLTGYRTGLQPGSDLPVCHRPLLSGALLQGNARHHHGERHYGGQTEREDQEPALAAVHRGDGLSV